MIRAFTKSLRRFKRDEKGHMIVEFALVIPLVFTMFMTSVELGIYQMRQMFLDMYIPKLQELDMSFPDEELKKNKESGQWEFGDPDWDEFFEVIKGTGPCNDERLAVRRLAEESGQWVREALTKKSESYVAPLA